MELVTIEGRDATEWRSPQWQAENSRKYCSLLEQGNILYFPESPYPVAPADLDYLRAAEQGGGSLHKNIAYRPASDRVTGLAQAGPQSDRIREIMRGYTKAASEFVSGFLSPYKWRLDYASLRCLEEEGRDLSIRSRNDLVHVDAFPSRPTNGDLIMRVFTNFNPSQGRVWLTSDPFAEFIKGHADKAGLPRIAQAGSSPLRPVARKAKALARALGLKAPDRAPYDEFMLQLHDYMKMNDDYQGRCNRHRFEFPAGSSWIVFTDVVPHAVLSGQFALEQTFIVSHESLADPAHAPVAILEKVAGARLRHSGTAGAG